MLVYFGTLDNTFSFYIGCSDWHHEVFLLPTKRRSLSPMINFFCGTSTLMLGRGQFVTCVFALHAPVRSSDAILQAPHRQPPQSVDSGLQVPSGPLVVSGAATSLATESVESGVVEPSASVAQSSTAAQGLPQGPIRWTSAGQLWLQIRATGSAAHPPSTQSDGNRKPVCSHLLPASFVCAVKPIFLLGTSDKTCKKNGSRN